MECAEGGERSILACFSACALQLVVLRPSSDIKTFCFFVPDVKSGFSFHFNLPKVVLFISFAPPKEMNQRKGGPKIQINGVVAC